MSAILLVSRSLAPASRKDYSQGKQWDSEPLSSITFVLIIAGLLFGGATALIGFVGLPTLSRPADRRITLWVGIGGFLLWAGVFLLSLRITF